MQGEEPNDFAHTPVMVHQIVRAFAAVPGGTYVDATLGGGGHAEAILDARPDLDLVGIDRDPAAREAAGRRLARFGSRCRIVAARFDSIAAVAASSQPVTAVLFDFGVSSPQLDRSDRGFSYRHEGPLDMRMNPQDPLTASEIVNEFPVEELAAIIRDGSDEKFAYRIAERIVAARPINTTTELTETVVAAIPAATRRTGGHPAKRTFQALRIAVNAELEQIPRAIDAAIELLSPGGRGAILTYHSGEDRLTKAAIDEAETGGCRCPQRLPCGCGAKPQVGWLRPKSQRPTDDEMQMNPRSASARLRCFEKLAGGDQSP